MARKSDVESLRAEVLRRQRAAGKKLSAIKSRTGLEMSKTYLDPRKDRSLISKYNTKQLKSQLDRLNSFIDRKTQFVAGAGNTPIEAKLWREYKQQEKKFNSRIQKHFDVYGDLDVSGTGMTVAQLRRAYTPDHPTMGSTAVNGLEPVNRKPHRVTSSRALEKLVKDMKRKNESDYIGDLTKRLQGEVFQMIDSIHLPRFKKEIEDLHPIELTYLLNHTTFVHDLSTTYIAKRDIGKLSPGMKALSGEILKDNVKSAKAILQKTKSFNVRGRLGNNNK